MLRIVYHMLKDGTFYQDLGPDYRGPKIPNAPPRTSPTKSELSDFKSKSKSQPDMTQFQERG